MDLDAAAATVKQINANIADLNNQLLHAAALKLHPVDPDAAKNAKALGDELESIAKRSDAPLESARRSLLETENQLMDYVAKGGDAAKAMGEWNRAQGRYQDALDKDAASGKGFNEELSKQSDAFAKLMDGLAKQIDMLGGSRDAAYAAAAAEHQLTGEQAVQYEARLKLFDNTKAAQAMREKEQEAMIQERVAAGKLTDQLDFEYRALFMTNDQREREQRLMETGLVPWGQDYAAREKQIEQIQQMGHQMDLLRDVADTVKTGFVDAFQSIFDKGKSGFADLMSNIEKWFIKLLADLALMAAENPIRMVLTTAAGWMGVSNPEAASCSRRCPMAAWRR